MSKQCMMRREARRQKLAKKYAAKRDELRAIKDDPSVGLEDKMAANAALQKLPRDSAACRGQRRCWMTGRPRGVTKFIGLCRNKFREYAMFGYIPGISKASW